MGCSLADGGGMTMTQSGPYGKSELTTVNNFSDDSKKNKRPIARSMALILATGALLLAGCCRTPIVVGPRHLGIGLYQVDAKSVNPDVDYYRIEGVGVLYANGRLSLGYGDHQWVHAHVDGRSYRASTPLADFAVGHEAEKAGIAFVFPDNLSSERSK